VSLLEVRHLSKRFGGLQAVRDLSFVVEPGEIVALIGPNGAGKTTVFGLVSGFLDPDTGEITFRGRSIRGLRPHRVNALGLARTFQIMRPFPRLSVARNVMIATLGRHPDPREAEARAHALLAQVGLDARAAVAAGALTLAERKRLEIARALAARPQLLLLDEPLGGLTTTEVSAALAQFRRIQAEGITLVIVEHNVHAVRSLCDRVIVLNSGRLIAEGRPAEVLSRSEVIEVYLGKASRAALQ